jgi:gamma-glutamylcyclotransferase (GGCT)/AIG2-like uncharacterized protein YtfP
LTTRLFVYGTLSPGHDAWAELEPWVVGTPQPDSVPGRLYDTGRGYPGATFAGGGNAVHGTVVTLDPERARAALEALDRYEGPEYERISVRTQAGVDAATYAWIAPLTGCRAVATGRWPESESRRPRGR